MIVKNLGNVTAYADAVAAGYTGTREQFAQEIANAATYAGEAHASETAAAGSAEDAEAYAVGKRGGVDVEDTDPTYHNNAKYYATSAAGDASDAKDYRDAALQAKNAANADAGYASADALVAEGYSSGTQAGDPVESGSPYYHNNAKYYAEQAETSAGNASTSEINAGLSETAASGSASAAAADALKAEGYAIGKQNGADVASGSPYYHNSAKYYKEQAAASATASAAMTGLAPAFSASTAYAAGDYVIYSGTLYKFNVAHAAGAWTGSDASAVTLAPDVTQLKSDLNQIAITWIGTNILNPAKIIEGAYISDANGTITPNANYWYTELIEVKPNTQYSFYTRTNDVNQTNPISTRYIAMCYDSNGDALPSTYVNQAVYYITFETTADTKFVKLSSTIQVASNFTVAYQLTEGNTFTIYAPYSEFTVLKDSANYLYGKKWVACGDSFTHGDATGATEWAILTEGKYAGQNIVYPFIIGNRNNMTIVNEAVNGSTMCLNDGTHNAFSTANGRYTQIPDDADYITLYFGINDGNYSSPIGTIDDADNTTFYGAWNVVLDYIMTHHPYAKIGIIITNGTSMNYINAEKAVAEKWGIPYLDMNGIQTPVMNRSNNQSITNDVRAFRTLKFSVNYPNNTHPSPTAHKYESTFIEAWLRTL